MNKVRITDSGKKKQQEIDNISKTKIRETPEEKEQNRKFIEDKYQENS